MAEYTYVADKQRGGGGAQVYEKFVLEEVKPFVEKNYRHDPSQRARFRSLVKWWIDDQISQLIRALRGKHVLPFSMILAEFCGGMVGISGEYSRSLRRIAMIRKDFA